MAVNLSHYEYLAKLFAYPEKKFLGDVEETVQFLEKNHQEAFVQVRDFYQVVAQKSLYELQELYTRSFDVQSITTLDVGYVLFGDDYKRGELLVNLRREHTKANNDCHTELADHLPVILRLLQNFKLL